MDDAKNHLAFLAYALQERARKVNIWVFLLMGGPFLGAFMSAWLITTISWRADYGVCAGLYVFSMLMVIVLGDETLYDRGSPKPREKGILGRIKLLTGWTGVKEADGRPTLWTVCVDIIKVQIKPQILFLSECRTIFCVAQGADWKT